ncbi:MAG: ABC transporter permease subunit [Deltaproteobacteria bacterium]|nr:ABC transporter permease subunit [Deltaproteobacteria bacterium]
MKQGYRESEPLLRSIPGGAGEPRIEAAPPANPGMPPHPGWWAGTWAVLVKEIREMGRSPLLHLLGAVFLGLAGYFFYTDLLYFDLMNQDGAGLMQGLWQRYFEDIRLCLLTILPVLGARAFAEEKRRGTMEMLLTYPLGEGQLVAGKFLALLIVLLPLLGITLTYPFVLGLIWPVDPRPLVAAYLGVTLLAVACLSLGMLCSALARQQSAAALAAFGVLSFLWFLNWNEFAASPAIANVLQRLSLFDRFYDFSRGTVRSADVAYFLMITAGLSFAARETLRWPWHRRRPARVLRIALVAAIAIGFDQLVLRRGPTWELSREADATLAAHAARALAGVETAVELTFFYEPGRYSETEFFADRYRRASPRIAVRLADLDREPSLARRYRVTAYGEVVVRSGERWTVVDEASDGAIVRAVLDVTDPKPRVVCATTGHGESEIFAAGRAEGEQPRSVGELLERIGYRWRELALDAAPGGAADCGIVLANGPKRDFTAAEVDGVAAFVGGGGAALLLLDPLDTPNLAGLAGRYGVVLGDRVSADGSSRLYRNDRYTLAATGGLESAGRRHFAAVLYDARQIGIAGDGAEPRGFPFLHYRSPRRGEVPLAAAIGRNGADGGVIVVGDSDFLDGRLFTRMSSQDLFVEMVQWLARPDELPRDRGARDRFAPLTERQARICLGTAMMPAIVFFGVGGARWWRRRWT